MNKLGIKGFLLKSGGIVELEKAIEEVMNGGTYISEQLVKKIIVDYTRTLSGDSKADIGLTALETEIMQLICQNTSNEDITKQLSISPLTLKKNKENLLKKVSLNYTEQESFKDIGYMLN